MLASKILLRCFYLGLFGWYKHALDMIVGGNFLECEETKALNAINGLVSLFMEDNDKNSIHDILDKIINMIGKLNLNEVERPLQDGQVLLELENGWEPYIKISIDNQSFTVYCGLGSMISTMPKMVYDYLKYENMIDHTYYHPHANGIISKIRRIVKNVQAYFHNKTIPIDFMRLLVG